MRAIDLSSKMEAGVRRGHHPPLPVVVTSIAFFVGLV